jgi:hypothetical protein
MPTNPEQAVPEGDQTAVSRTAMLEMLSCYLSLQGILQLGRRSSSIMDSITIDRDIRRHSKAIAAYDFLHEIMNPHKIMAEIRVSRSDSYNAAVAVSFKFKFVRTSGWRVAFLRMRAFCLFGAWFATGLLFVSSLRSDIRPEGHAVIDWLWPRKQPLAAPIYWGW